MTSTTSNQPVERDFRPTLFTGTVEFVATFSSVIIGLGNFWKFPYLVYMYKGGAFIIMYLFVLFITGKPMMLLELGLGQFAKKGNIEMFYRLGTMYTGLGITQMVTNFCAMSYYAVIIAILAFYFSQTFREVLPWTTCTEEWSQYCFNKSENNTNETLKVSSEQMYFMTEIFFEYEKSEKSSFSNSNWGLAVALFVVWLLAFCNMYRGISGMGFFNYFFCLMPWVITIVFVGKSISLPGSYQGVKAFFYVDWSVLASAKAWVHCTCHTMFSLGVGFGTTSMYASYSCMNTNIKKVSTAVVILDGLLSIAITFALFATVGNMAHVYHADMENIIISGSTGRWSFVFIVYSYLVSTFQLPYLTSAIFFFMLIWLGIDSLVSFSLMIISQFLDVFPKCCGYMKLCFTVAVFGFLCGLPFLVPAGQLFVRTIEFFGVTMPISLIGMLECSIIAYCHGVRRFVWDLEFIIGERPDFLSIMGWRLPGLIMLVDFVTFIIGSNEIRLGEKLVHPLLVAFGWILSITALIPIPGLAIATIAANYKKKCPKMITYAISIHKWRPGDTDEVANYRYFISEKEKELSERKKKCCGRFWDWFIGR